MGQTPSASNSIWVKLHLGRAQSGSNSIWVELHLGRAPSGSNSIWVELHLGPTQSGSSYIWVQLNLGRASSDLSFNRAANGQFARKTTLKTVYSKAQPQPVFSFITELSILRIHNDFHVVGTRVPLTVLTCIGQV